MANVRARKAAAPNWQWVQRCRRPEEDPTTGCMRETQPGQRTRLQRLARQPRPLAHPTPRRHTTPVTPVRAAYLADTSAFTRLDKPHVAAAIGPLIAEGKIALCSPVAFELGFSARNAADHDAIISRVDAFETAPATQGDHQRAVHLQQLLAQRGHHRALSLVDALVAAIAEARNLTILHYDADFELVSDITGQPTQWIVKAGTAD